MSAAIGRMIVLRIVHQTGTPKPFVRRCPPDVRRVAISPTFVMRIPLYVLIPVSTRVGSGIFDTGEDFLQRRTGFSGEIAVKITVKFYPSR